MDEPKHEAPTVAVEPVVGLRCPMGVAEALLYSRNYASASPYLNRTAREHILGLCDLLHATNEQTKRLHAALRHAREVLAEFHHAGDVPDSLEVIDAALQPNAKAHRKNRRSEAQRNGGGFFRCSALLG